MDPIIFTIPGTNFSLHWYGVIMAVGIILAGLVAEWGVKLRGENGDHIWDLIAPDTHQRKDITCPLPLHPQVLKMKHLSHRIWLSNLDFQA